MPEAVEAALRYGQTLKDEGTLRMRSGLRAIVHAHSAESMRAATLAGCTQIEHGVFATPEVLALMAERKVYFDPQV